MTQIFPTPPGYRIVSLDELPRLAAEIPRVANLLGGESNQWQAHEISDGNMNAVYRLHGPSGSVVVKQALPYIRAIGADWPFPVSRALYEAEALAHHASLTPDHVPHPLHLDEQLALLMMEDLSDHHIARSAFIEGRPFAHLGSQIGNFLARTLFLTSGFHLPAEQCHALASRFSGNAHLCATTEDVIFTSPYGGHAFNRTTPGTEAMAARYRDDDELKQAATEMKLIFRTRSESLVHGDLHTGSLMVTDTDTRVIDAEWAFHGPMGFDPGVLIGNMLIAAISQPGHRSASDDRQQMSAWLLSTTRQIWQQFHLQFRRLAHHQEGGLPAIEILDESSIAALTSRHLKSVLADSLGFAGAEMIRRIIGIAHVDDFERIADQALRSELEQRALGVARQLLLTRHKLSHIDDALELVDRLDRI